MRRLLLVFVLMMSTVVSQTVDFDTDIQPIFDARCVGCHGVNGGLSLASGQSFNNLVNVSSRGYFPTLRVAPGDTTLSVLYHKAARTGVHGNPMPPSGDPLTSEQITKIATWISELPAQTPITIAEAKLDTLGAIVTLQGIVTSPNFSASSTRTDHTIQDATGAINVFAFSFDKGLNVGDAVSVTGELDQYNGKFEIIPAGEADVTVVSTGNALPDIQVLTIADLLADAENYESEFIRIDSATIVVGETWPSSGSSANLDITDPSGAILTMRIDADTDVDENEMVLGYFNLQGVVVQYDGSDPYDSGYQIFPRYYTDFAQIGDPAPQVSNVHRNPASPTPSDSVLVEAMIVDNVAVAGASIKYNVDGGADTIVVMVPEGNDMYSGMIPPQAGNALVRYMVIGTDNLGTEGASNEFSFIVYDGVVTSIASIQDGTVATDSIVTVQGIVTAEPYAFDSESNIKYYFMQDDLGAQSGIKVFDAGRGVIEGDEIRITGTVTEYYDMTEIIDITAFEVLSSGNKMDPLMVTLDADMELYEGCLIEVTDVTVANPDLGYGEWSVSDGTNTLVLDDDAKYYYTPVQDEALASIVGVLDYSFGAYKLQPRLAQDIQTNDGFTRIQAIQQVRYSDLMLHYSGLDSSLYFRDTSYYFAGWTDTTIVTVEGIVTMPTGLSYAGAGVKFILQDANGGPWSSMLSYHQDSTAFSVLFEGDLVQLAGYIVEFTTPGTGGSASMTELYITQDDDLIDIGLAVPEEPIIKTGDLRWPTTAEQWGNVNVKVVDATIVENNPTGFDILSIDDGSGSVLVDDDSDSLSAFGANPYIQPPAGSVFDEVRGWVYHHYGSYDDSTTYKLVPLYKSDLVLHGVAVDNVQIPQGYALGNYPNPFNPITNIAFRVPEAQQVQLVIYNQLGQHVVTLMDQSVGAGDYEVPWKGVDAKGKPVSSGLYFYRLIAGTKQMVGKMTYLK